MFSYPLVRRQLLPMTLLLGLLLRLSGPGRAQTIQGTYAIQNVQTGQVLRIQDAQSQNGTPLVAYPLTNWKCMTWDFQHVAGSTYQLRNLFSAKTFQPQAAATAAATLEEQPLKPGSAQQQWEFTTVAANTYRIRQAGTDLYVTPVDPKGATNSRMALRPKAEGPLQYWTLHEQHPTF